MNYTVNLEQIDDYNTHKLVVNPKRAALLVIEMQNVFRNDLNMISDKQLDNIKTIIEASEKAGVNIIYVRHNDSAEISKSMVDWWNGDKIEYGSELEPGQKRMKKDSCDFVQIITRKIACIIPERSYPVLIIN